MSEPTQSCRNCHRPLRDPTSRARQYGPKCWADRQPRPDPDAPAVRAPHASQVPGQLELDDEDQEDDQP